MKNRLIGKGHDAEKDWRQVEKGTTEDEMVGWHHQLDGHEFVQALVVDDGQGNLACCSPCGCKELDTTEQLNWTDHLIPVRMVIVKKSANTGEGVDKMEPYCTVEGMEIDEAIMENNMEIPLRIKNKNTIWLRNLTAGHIP